MIVFSGNYTDAIKLDTVHGWSVDPATGLRSRRTSIKYSPLRNGIRKFYDEAGVMIREEQYEDGVLRKEKNKSLTVVSA